MVNGRSCFRLGQGSATSAEAINREPFPESGNTVRGLVSRSVGRRPTKSGHQNDAKYAHCTQPEHIAEQVLCSRTLQQHFVPNQGNADQAVSDNGHESANFSGSQVL